MNYDPRSYGYNPDFDSKRKLPTLWDTVISKPEEITEIILSSFDRQVYLPCCGLMAMTEAIVTRRISPTELLTEVVTAPLNDGELEDLCQAALERNPQITLDLSNYGRK